MACKVPQEITDRLNEIIQKLNEIKYVKPYRCLIGNPDGAHLKDFDDSSWPLYHEPVILKKHQGITWIRFTIKVPDQVMGIPMEGTGVRLTPCLSKPDTSFYAPVYIYVNGELRFHEKTWVDFKVPELYLTENAVPGQEFCIAIKLELCEFNDWDSLFFMNCVQDIVEDIEFEIASFREELGFASRFEEVRDVLPGIFEMIAEPLKGEDLTELVRKIRLSREILMPMQAEAKKYKVHLIGHAHLDMNWFWTMDETIDLIKRDFGTMTHLMEENPDFRFSQSQCATYEIAEKHHPEVFKRMEKFIRAGNWDVTASAWVEGDMNMASGEAIARHILYSKKYLKEKFDMEPEVMWCPDTFGHSANIPGLLNKSGIGYYYFYRCGPKVRGMEYDHKDFVSKGPETPVFIWEGLDGSRVLAYNLVYSSDVNTANVLNTSKRIFDRYGLTESMLVYGTCDHGGGPTRRDIRRARQLNSYPTLPRIEFSTTREFFHFVTNENSPALPVVKGELNFTFDGCYTTHSDIKKYNRMCENELASTEILGSLANMHGLAYPRLEILECWKTTLFNQFHDIFDGTGIKATYAYSIEKAGKALDVMCRIKEKCAEYIGSKIKTTGRGIPVVFFNTTGWERSGCFKIKKPDTGKATYQVTDTGGNRLPVQTSGDALYVFAEKLPAVGYKVLYLEEGLESEFDKIIVKNEFFEIQTKYYLVEIRKSSGEITTLFDRINGRFVVRREQIGWRLRNGVLNTLQVHDEMPVDMSSWTIGPVSSVRHLIKDAKATIKEDGPVVKIINFEHRFGNSFISQDITIYNDSPRIDFVTNVDWGESGGPEREASMLKACFTPDIDSNCAAYEIPFGAIERPCKDLEVPALKWADISDEEYGFSLLNDCKYGHKAIGNRMEITLIRSGWQPDPESDVGKHNFKYSILPHAGNWKEADTVKQGYFLNNDMIALYIKNTDDPVLPEIFSFAEVNCNNMVTSALKPAETGEGFILRMYESAGIPSKVKIKFGFDIEEVEEMDIGESRIFDRIPCVGGSFEFETGGFEIKTFRLHIKTI